MSFDIQKKFLIDSNIILRNKYRKRVHNLYKFQKFEGTPIPEALLKSEYESLIKVLERITRYSNLLHPDKKDDHNNEYISAKNKLDEIMKNLHVNIDEVKPKDVTINQEKKEDVIENIDTTSTINDCENVTKECEPLVVEVKENEISPNVDEYKPVALTVDNLKKYEEQNNEPEFSDKQDDETLSTTTSSSRMAIDRASMIINMLNIKNNRYKVIKKPKPKVTSYRRPLISFNII